MHAGLVALLGFLDEQPGWARFLMLEPPVAGGAICERRHHAVRALAGALEHETRTIALIAERRAVVAERRAPSAQLTAELIVGGVLAVVRTQMLERPEQSLSGLTPSLMAFVERPYRSGDRAGEAQPAAPARRVTYRTARVLGAIAAAPRSNNREIAQDAGLRDEGQTSKLLSRLERRGLLENVGLGAAYGEPNAWLLTTSGEQMLTAARRLWAADAGRASVRRVIRGAA